MELAGKRVVVVGLGASGLAAARLCLARGATVVGTDTRPLESLPRALRDLPCTLVVGGHHGARLRDADLIVVSPGVPPLAELDAAEAAGVEVIGELELACRFASVPVLVVGGTNGKSTTTTALGVMLDAAGHKAFVGGNLGRAACQAVGEPYDVWLLEVSSFQLERAPELRPRVSVLLNISEDHLDRYPSLAAYARAKGNAFVRQAEGDAAVVPAGDALCLAEARRGHGKLVTFGAGADYRLEHSQVSEVATGAVFDLSGSAFVGTPNHLDAAAAIAAARAFGLSVEAVLEGLERFRPLAHRLARVGVLAGVTFYDDSKATNVAAAVSALQGVPEPRAVLIAGGRDKLGDYQELRRALLERGRAVVVLGEAAERIEAALAGALPVERVGDMQQAVQRAFERAQPGDAVLLSPACSSLDMYSGYAERGDRFVAAFSQLQARRAS